MSHIGKKIIMIPADVNLNVTETDINISGKYGSLKQSLFPNIKIIISGNELNLIKLNSNKITASYYGLLRTLISNMIIGVTNKFQKNLFVEGVGYKFQLDSNILILIMGFSYFIKFIIPEEINVILNSPTKLALTSINKEKLGLFAARIRNIRPPEPYKGKGIRYENEIIKRKIGKKGK
jgi:large subunit ribosomal protein L6